MAVLDGARIFHVNVNCADLERSRRFYEHALGLEAAVRTSPEQAQPGAAFGLAEARWDAWILCGRHGFDGGAIDLLEWQVPRPIGAAPASLAVRGFQRLGVLVDDLDAVMARAGGGSSFAHDQIRLALVRDPDGVAIELVEMANAGPALSFVSVACVDLDASVAFYTRLGLREVARYPSHNDDGSHLGIDGPVTMDEVVMRAPAGDVLLMLVGFRLPAVNIDGARAANTIGMWRAAFLVDDLDTAVRELGTSGVATISPPVALAMGEGLPTLRFVCFRGPDDEVIELIQSP